MDNKHCRGCRDNFYNGNNNLGVSECWSPKTAKLIWRRRVRMDERPPWNAKCERLPDCYGQQGFVFVKPENHG